MTGAALASQLMSKTGCFSLILSGHADPESVSSAVRNGALGYLVKPLSIAVLVPAIETALARARELGGLQRSHDQLSLAVGENRDTSVAVGVLMERLRIDQDAAFAKLRDAARDQRRKLAEFAREVVLAANTLNGVGRS
jgi:response regulator NasT